MRKVSVYTQIWLRLSTEMREGAIRKKEEEMHEDNGLYELPLQSQ
jgi:hypothetical protein